MGEPVFRKRKRTESLRRVVWEDDAASAVDTLNVDMDAVALLRSVQKEREMVGTAPLLSTTSGTQDTAGAKLRADNAPVGRLESLQSTFSAGSNASPQAEGLARMKEEFLNAAVKRRPAASSDSTKGARAAVESSASEDLIQSLQEKEESLYQVDDSLALPRRKQTEDRIGSSDSWLQSVQRVSLLDDN